STQRAAPAKSTSASSAAAVRHNILPLKKINNVSVLLKNFKMSPKQVKEELLRLLCEGTCAMSEDQVDNLILQFPTEEERKELLGYTGAVSELYEGEQLMMELALIPNLDQKATVFKLMRDFEPKILVSPQ
ncbi:formin-like protein, partial [Haematococcus lacustris]